MVDFHREVNGDCGWRGPAELLKLDRQEGTAILSYQGRPYLVSLRHIRAHQAGVFLAGNQAPVDELKYLKDLTMSLSPYKVVTVGFIREYKDGVITRRQSSSSSLILDDVWKHVVKVANALSDRTVGGVMMGQAVRALHPPKASIGVMFLWSSDGDDEGAIHEHLDDSHLIMKKITTLPNDKLAFLYFFYYSDSNWEPTTRPVATPSAPPPEPMALDSGEDEMPNSTVNEGDTFPGEETMSLKRKGLDTRTIVIGPERKRSKLEYLMKIIATSQVINVSQHNMINLYWLMHRVQAVPRDFPHAWCEYDNHPAIALWMHTWQGRHQTIPAIWTPCERSFSSPGPARKTACCMPISWMARYTRWMKKLM